ncbi:DUF4411 family protein [Mesorhizobium amorphae]|uniref:DUF4411 family protein n=1 Tax=Mesorhizobium amorphae TaxID=71433 RepID=UPI003ECF9AA8
MKSYCLDTSGFSNPLEILPEDIYTSLWAQVKDIVLSGRLACNKEIFDELGHINGSVGDCLRSNCELLQLEVGEDSWNWVVYLEHVERMKEAHRPVISEYNGGRKGTVGLNDISIIALAKTLGVPLISMEAESVQQSDTRRRIPAVCDMENVVHLNFNQFLRAEGIRI